MKMQNWISYNIMLKMFSVQISDSFPFGEMELPNIIHHRLWK